MTQYKNRKNIVLIIVNFYKNISWNKRNKRSGYTPAKIQEQLKVTHVSLFLSSVMLDNNIFVNKKKL